MSRREQGLAYVEFTDALLDFNDDPTPANLERYLTASHALEESRGRSANAKEPSPVPAR